MFISQDLKIISSSNAIIIFPKRWIRINPQAVVRSASPAPGTSSSGISNDTSGSDALLKYSMPPEKFPTIISGCWSLFKSEMAAEVRKPRSAGISSPVIQKNKSSDSRKCHPGSHQCQHNKKPFPAPTLPPNDIRHSTSKKNGRLYP